MYSSWGKGGGGTQVKICRFLAKKHLEKILANSNYSVNVGPPGKVAQVEERGLNLRVSLSTLKTMRGY